MASFLNFISALGNLSINGGKKDKESNLEYDRSDSPTEAPVFEELIEIREKGETKGKGKEVIRETRELKGSPSLRETKEVVKEIRETRDIQREREGSGENFTRGPSKLASVSKFFHLTRAEQPTSPSEEFDEQFDSSDINKKLTEIFNLTEGDIYQKEFSCWLARETLLKGFIYLTKKHLCFYADVPDDELEDDFVKQGYLNKKSVGLVKNSHRYWFVLRGGTLRYHEDPDSTYFPLGIIDLKEVMRIEPNKSKEKNFSLLLPNRTLEVEANSLTEAFEWKKAIQEAMSKTHNETENVKIAIPLSSVMEWSLSTVLPVSESIYLKVESEDDTESPAEYLFTYFRHPQQAFLDISTAISEAQGTTSRPVQVKSFHTENNAEIFFRRVAEVDEQKASFSHLITEDEKQDEFKKIFKISEKVLADFEGFYINHGRYNGTIYLTKQHFAFVSKNLVSRDKMILIDYADIVLVQKLSSGIFVRYAFSLETKESKEFTFEAFSEGARQSLLEILIHKMDEIKAQKLIIKSPDFESVTPIRINDGNTEEIAPMNIAMVTIGTRGDVQPMLVFAKELQKRGHRVRISCHEEYGQWITNEGIEFKKFGGNPAELVNLMAQHTLWNPQFLTKAAGIFYQWFDELLAGCLDAALGMDCIVASPYSFGCWHVAESLNIPLFYLCPFPWTRTKEFPHPLFFPETLPLEIGSINSLTYSLVETLLWKTLSIRINPWRKKYLNLTTIPGKDDYTTPTINCFDPTLISIPKDWPDWIHTCGFFFHETSNFEPDASLVDFLSKRDKKIVYIGFGSIVVDDPDKIIETIVDAVRKANVRAVVSKGWTARISTLGKHKRRNSSVPLANQSSGTGVLLPSFANSPAPTSSTSATSSLQESAYGDLIYFLTSIPHDWLFPRMDALVHHGGAGTIASSIRAGKPVVIKPFFGDQLFWAERIEKFGVGVKCQELSSDKLAIAIHEVTTNTSIIAKAEELGRTIRMNNGPEKAVEAMMKDMHFAKAVVSERHKAHTLVGEGIAQLKNKNELQRLQIESLKKELRSLQSSHSHLPSFSHSSTAIHSPSQNSSQTLFKSPLPQIQNNPTEE